MSNSYMPVTAIRTVATALQQGWRVLPDDERALIVALLFCDNDDDTQAGAIETIARTMNEWDGNRGEMQLCYIGQHLAACECITDAGREWVRKLNAFMVPAHDASTCGGAAECGACAQADEQRTRSDIEAESARLREALQIILIQYGPYVDGQGAAKLHAIDIAREALGERQANRA